MAVPVLKAQHLGIQFGGLKAVDDFNMEIGESELVGLIGPNGAGKTTTIKSMLGLVHPDRGSVEMLGYDAAKDEKKIKAAIGYAGGAVGWYKKKSIELLASVTASFYLSWDDAMADIPICFRSIHAKRPSSCRKACGSSSVSRLRFRTVRVF